MKVLKLTHYSTLPFLSAISVEIANSECIKVQIIPFENKK